MRRSLLLAFSVMIMAGCTKSGTSSIVGQWELSESDGGLAGNIKYAPGNGNILKFDNVGVLTQFQSGSPVLTCHYQIAPAKPLSPIFLLTVMPPGIVQVTTIDSIRIDGNRLIFLPRSYCCDEATLIYLRKY